MATTTINITNGSTSPKAGPATVTDSTPTVTNYVAFTNETTHGVKITGSGGWSNNFSENNIVLPTSSGSNTATLALKVNGSTVVETVEYTIAYTNYTPPPPPPGEPEPLTDPVFTITVNP